jgi:tripartite ATP-independent transporter DctM subunit
MYDMKVAVAILLITFFVMILVKVPVTFALAISTAMTMIYCQVPLASMIQQMAKSINSFSLMAIPFFILMGEIMGAGGISKRMLAFANVIVGRMRGGLAQVNCVASMFFGGISGSAVADVSSLGTMLIPMMHEDGYDDDFSVGITVTSACQGLMIPPSHNMIMYSVAAGGLSVEKLFMAGYGPGIMTGVALMIVCYFIAKKRNYPRGKKVSLKEAAHISVDAVLALLTAVIIIGGVVLGIFTATESAAIACVYAFVIAVFVYRELKWKDIPKVLFRTVRTLATVFGLIAAAGAFGVMLARLQVPKMITEALLGVSDNKIIVFLIINILLLLLGCIMDMAPLILIMTPILLPVVASFGMSPIQFGIMLICNLGIGLCTPPVGSALFVGCGVGKIKVEKVVKGMMPMYIAMVIVLMLVTFVPMVSLGIPTLIYGPF